MIYHSSQSEDDLWYLILRGKLKHENTWSDQLFARDRLLDGLGRVPLR